MGVIFMIKFLSLRSDMDLGYFSPDTAFEICSPVNVVIRLFRPRDDMGHVDVIRLICGLCS